MHIHEATSDFEMWLSARVPLLADDRAEKHEAMKRSAFAFLRGSFYRWAQVFPKVCARLMDAPRVVAVGDLHVSNFGTWLDAQGNLVWGIHDFDEACRAPYANDLVRLAVSAMLLHPEGNGSAEGVCRVLLEGYEAGLLAKGRPLVVDREASFRALVPKYVPRAKGFWKKLHMLEAIGDVPRQITLAFQKALPRIPFRVVHRKSGLGSLGRRRFTALAEAHDGPVAFEAEELAPPAWSWAHGGAETILSARVLQTAVRAADPTVTVGRGWILRALSPHQSRLNLEKLPEKNGLVSLLGAMGWETANIHLGSGKRGEILADATLRRRSWLEDSALAMAASVTEDWKAWRRKEKRAAHSGR